MRTINVQTIRERVAKMVVDAALDLRPDVLAALEAALRQEKNKRAKNTLKIIIENAQLAKKNKIPICQDTGMTVVFCEIGRDVRISGDIEKAINDGVKQGSRSGSLRRSIVDDPVTRKNTGTNTPVIVHYSFRGGSKIKLSLLLKGFGCENKGAVVMLNPTASFVDIENQIVDVITRAGANACPPFVIGIGLGGTMDKACELAKKALLEPLGTITSKKQWVQKLSKNVKKRVNASNIGPLGLGGRTTVLDVKVKEHPTHIAGLPVAVNISCHALRSKVTLI